MVASDSLQIVPDRGMVEEGTLSRSWDGLLGQPGVVRRLTGALAGNRLSHALLFEGPQGVGKTRAAALLAGALQCEEAQGPCGTCRPCRMVEAGTHPDVGLVAPEGDSIKIDQIREVQQAAGLRPYRGSWQVFVLEPAEAMTEAAQNALLKVLEEPPGQVVFVLVAHSLQGVRPTILSRCRRISFGRLPAGLVAAELRRRGRTEGEAELLASLSDGRLGWAAVLDTDELEARRDQIQELVGGMPAAPLSDMIEAAAAWEGHKEDVPFRMDLLQSWLRDLLILREVPSAGPDAQGLILHRDRAEILMDQARRWPPGALVRAVGEVDQARRRLRRNANVRLTLDVLFLTLYRLVSGKA